MRITTSTSDLSIEQMMHIEKFTDEFKDMLKKLLSLPEYSHLRVLPTFQLTKRGKTPISISSNADLSIRKSRDLQSNIIKYLEDFDELEVYLPKQTLCIGLKYKEGPTKDADKSKPATDLPNFTPTKPRYTFDKVILPEETRKRIFEDLSIISKTEQVYRTWGFEEVDSIPRLILSFYGKPGTGKTMLAHAIAHQFDKPLLALNYSEIESKYVGDAAKNLKHAFDTAKSMDAVLFFDEADSFLGKRIQNVSQGSDQAINSLRSQMLILLEEHEGIVLFATNLVSNFDKAFESRFIDSIEIPLPNREARAQIIESMIPSRLPLERPLEKEDFLSVSDKIDGLAGREIKNAILKMLLAHADDPEHKFSLEDLNEAMDNKVKQINQLQAEKDALNGKTPKGKEITATPEEMDKIKDAVKAQIKDAPKIDLGLSNEHQD